MKRVNNLYQPLLNKDRIIEIIIKASKGKKRRREVKHVLENIDYYAEEILKMLQNDTYYLKPTRNRTIIEKGKVRNLTISPFFPNRILDYVIVETIKPTIRKGMYEYCVGNVDGRGILFGKKYIERHIKKCKYYIKLDIHHFYPSVKPEKLCECLRRYIKDQRFLKLADMMIMSNSDLPIGSYYSQWISNLFLQVLDHYVKEVLKVPHYVRYVDDMLLMGNNKKVLLNAMYKIGKYLNSLGLELKRIEQVRTFDDGPIDFLGYRFHQDKTKLRIRIFKQINKKVKKIRKTKHCSVSQARSLLSFFGWIKHLKKTGYLYYNNHIKPVIKIGFLRRITSLNA